MTIMSSAENNNNNNKNVNGSELRSLQ